MALAVTQGFLDAGRDAGGGTGPQIVVENPSNRIYNRGITYKF